MTTSSNQPINGTYTNECLVIAYTIGGQDYGTVNVSVTLSGQTVGSGILTASQNSWQPTLPFSTGPGSQSSTLTSCTVNLSVPVKGGQNGSLIASVGGNCGSNSLFAENAPIANPWTTTGSQPSR